MKLKAVLSSVLLGLALGTVEPPPARAAIEQTDLDLLRSRLRANDARAYDQPAVTTVFRSAGDRVVEAVVTWDRLRRADYEPSFSEAARYLAANPGWPDENLIRRKAEAALTPGSPFEDRIRLFERLPPQTGSAAFRLAEAYRATNRSQEALRWAREAWGSESLKSEDEPYFLTLFGGQMTPDDHLARVDALLWARRADDAERILPLVPAEAQGWARARIALVRNAPDAQALAAAVGGRWQNDAGLVYDRARNANDARNPMAARRIMADAKVQQGTPSDLVRWARLRLQLARDAERDRQFDLAYRIAAEHRSTAPGQPLSERPFRERDVLTDIEWLAGWIALHDLKRGADAVPHFARYAGIAKTPTTRSKGLYWAGRAAEAGGDRAGARRFLEQAAAFGETFYGMLAQERLGRAVALPPDGTPNPTAADRARFDGDPRVEATRALIRLNDDDRAGIFLRSLAENADSAVMRRQVADLGRGAGHLEPSVIAGKRGRGDGDEFARFAYPIIPLPGEAVEQATMVHAITRQESQFNLGAVSSAGARGLMQLMPGTAQEVSGKIGEGYSIRRLTTDATYNLRLGSRYYQDVRNRWDGSHVLAVASYNAGPGNVRRWVTQNGDPRSGGVDTLEWIEAIPFSETRNYVQRVLENAVVYDLLKGVPPPAGRRDRLSYYLGKGEPG